MKYKIIEHIHRHTDLNQIKLRFEELFIKYPACNKTQLGGKVAQNNKYF